MSAVESLYGVTCVQTFIYFQNYSCDNIWLKATVSGTTLKWSRLLTVQKGGFFVVRVMRTEAPAILTVSIQDVRHSAPCAHNKWHIFLCGQKLYRSICSPRPDSVRNSFFFIFSYSSLWLTRSDRTILVRRSCLLRSLSLD